MSSLFMRFVNFDMETFPLLGNILPENDCVSEFDSYLFACQVLEGFMEFTVGLVQFLSVCP